MSYQCGEDLARQLGGIRESWQVLDGCREELFRQLWMSSLEIRPLPNQEDPDVVRREILEAEQNLKVRKAEEVAIVRGNASFVLGFYCDVVCVRRK